MDEKLKYTLDTDTDAEVAAGVLAIFGDRAEFTRAGKYCHVIVARPIASIAEQIAAWSPADIFDSACPHCQPFIEKGSYIVWTHDGVHAYRRLPNNRYETVGMPTPKLAVPSAARGL
jgi:hypothetical protein